MTWQGALDYAACLNANSYLGYNDWRLPNINELRSLLNVEVPDSSVWLNTEGFIYAQSYDYWSSTTYMEPYPPMTQGYTSLSIMLDAWGVGMVGGYVHRNAKFGLYYVWCVRGMYETLGNFTISLPVTGQTMCYNIAGTTGGPCIAGQDSNWSIQAGVAWPDPRFTDNGNSTVTDNLTGLIWTQDTGTPGPAACSPGVEKTWQGALDYIKCLNTNSYLGHTDWRLPNVNELRSLINANESNNDWLNKYGFINTPYNPRWSSSTNVSYTFNAWQVRMYDGQVRSKYKTYYTSVWPVRGGQAGSSSQNSYAATLSGSFLLHEPYFTINGSSLWLDLQYTQDAQFSSTDLMFRLSNYGGVTNLSDYSNCQASALSVVGSNYVLHIPMLILGGTSYWLDLTYVSTTDGLFWFKLTNYGVN